MRMNYHILPFLANEGKYYSTTTTKPPLGRQSILIVVRPFDNRERFISNCLSSLPSLNMTIFFPKSGKAFNAKVNVCLSSVPLMPPNIPDVAFTTSQNHRFSGISTQKLCIIPGCRQLGKQLSGFLRQCFVNGRPIRHMLPS